MSEWKVKRIGDMMDIFSGYAFKSSEFDNNGNIPVIKIGNINFFDVDIYNNISYVDEETYKKIDEKYIVKYGDVLISLTGSNINQPNSIVGRVGRYREQTVSVLNQRAGKLVPFEGFSKDFIYHLFSLKSMTYQIASVAYGGANQVNISPTTIKKFKVKIPSLDIQNKIANILSTYDKLIENNNRRIQILEQTAEELYKEWFVRMRFPGYEKTKFDKGIPEGWEVKKIGDLFNVSSSKRVYSSDYVESGIPFYRSKEVIKLSNGESISDLLYISENKYMEFKRKFGVPNRNDILITSVGTIGIPLLITNDNPFYFKDGNLTWIQSSSNPFLSYYLYCWLKSDIGYQSLSMFTIGTSQRALTITNLKRLKLLLPDETLLYKFNNLFKNLNTKINNLNQQNQTLTKQRDLLLPRLMNGTITVK